MFNSKHQIKQTKRLRARLLVPSWRKRDVASDQLMAAVLWHCVLLYMVIPARIIALKLWRLPCGPKDCYEARCFGDEATQPIINTKTSENSYDQLHIQCNHSYAGGGWTIIQARISLTLPDLKAPGKCTDHKSERGWDVAQYVTQSFHQTISESVWYIFL